MKLSRIRDVVLVAALALLALPTTALADVAPEPVLLEPGVGRVALIVAVIAVAVLATFLILRRRK